MKCFCVALVKRHVYIYMAEHIHVVFSTWHFMFWHNKSQIESARVTQMYSDTTHAGNFSVRKLLKLRRYAVSLSFSVGHIGHSSSRPNLAANRRPRRGGYRLRG